MNTVFHSSLKQYIVIVLRKKRFHLYLPIERLTESSKTASDRPSWIRICPCVQRRRAPFQSYIRYNVMDSHRHLVRLWGTKPLSHRPSWPIEDVLSFRLEHKTSRFLQKKNKQTVVTSSFHHRHHNFFLKNFVLCH